MRKRYTKRRRSLRRRRESLRDVAKIQRQPGNYDYDEYMHGMAIGLEVAVAIMEDREPEFVEAPKQWLRDRK